MRKSSRELVRMSLVCCQCNYQTEESTDIEQPLLLLMIISKPYSTRQEIEIIFLDKEGTL